jgi:hypothetical protein
VWVVVAIMLGPVIQVGRSAAASVSEGLPILALMIDLRRDVPGPVVWAAGSLSTLQVRALALLVANGLVAGWEPEAVVPDAA